MPVHALDSQTQSGTCILKQALFERTVWGADEASGSYLGIFQIFAMYRLRVPWALMQGHVECGPKVCIYSHGILKGAPETSFFGNCWKMLSEAKGPSL